MIEVDMAFSHPSYHASNDFFLFSYPHDVPHHILIKTSMVLKVMEPLSYDRCLSSDHIKLTQF